MPDKLLQGKELIERLDGIERAGMAVTRQWFTLWSDAVSYMWGEQLQGVRRNPDWDYIVINYIYPLVMQGIAKLSKNSPKLLARAWKEEEAEWAEHWQGLIQYIWEQVLNMREDAVRAMLDSAVYGYAVGKTYWDPKVYWDDRAKVWVGEVGHRLIHPCGFWVDPRAERIADAECCGTVRKVSLEWAVHHGRSSRGRFASTLAMRTSFGTTSTRMVGPATAHRARARFPSTRISAAVRAAYAGTGRGSSP